MDASTINWLAILVASVAGFLVGGIWYGPLFGKAWMKEVGITEEDIQAAKNKMAKTYSITWVLTLIIAVNLGFFFNDPSIDGTFGAIYGFATGFGFMAMAIAVNALFEGKSLKYILINGGYWTVLVTLMGFIIGVWK